MILWIRLSSGSSLGTRAEFNFPGICIETWCLNFWEPSRVQGVHSYFGCLKSVAYPYDPCIVISLGFTAFQSTIGGLAHFGCFCAFQRLYNLLDCWPPHLTRHSHGRHSTITIPVAPSAVTLTLGSSTRSQQLRRNYFLTRLEEKHGGARAGSGGGRRVKMKEGVWRRKRLKRRRWWWLCSGEDLKPSSLGEFLEVERRFGEEAVFDGEMAGEIGGGGVLFADGRVLPPSRGVDQSDDSMSSVCSICPFSVSFAGICS
ncbi:hypothetical protein Tco_1048381 [Tanacetum coccineum]